MYINFMKMYVDVNKRFLLIITIYYFIHMMSLNVLFPFEFFSILSKPTSITLHIIYIQILNVAP